jgi:hypothetical protein
MGGSRATTLTAYHGTKHWQPGAAIRAASVAYQLSRGSSLRDARAHARGLLRQLMDPAPDRVVLSMALYQAQALGASSPFVSTSRKRSVALSFALDGGTSGYCIQIVGPSSEFFDFNAVRERHQIPHRPEFRWLEELGIPLEVRAPFKVVRVDLVKRIGGRGKAVFVDKP